MSHQGKATHLGCGLRMSERGGIAADFRSDLLSRAERDQGSPWGLVRDRAVPPSRFRSLAVGRDRISAVCCAGKSGIELGAIILARSALLPATHVTAIVGMSRGQMCVGRVSCTGLRRRRLRRSIL